MANNSVLYICLFWILLCFSEVSLERTKDKMYEPISGAAACFRRLNGTHQFGCSSKRSGSVGAIHLIDEDSDLTWLLEKGDAPPYMAVLGPEMFTRKVLLALRDSGKVSGVLLVHDLQNHTEIPLHYSPEDTCPNRYSGQKRCTDDDPWNPKGMGLLQIDWGFPMFYLSSSSNDSSGNIQKIRACYQRYNVGESQVGRTLCAIEMKSYMSAAVSSEVCVRRNGVKNNFHPVHVCDPLIDRNVWLSLPALTKNRPNGAYNRSVIMVSARLDATSMFDQIVPGATSPVLGVIALLCTAHALSHVFPQDNTQQNSTVLFTLLHGESYDYIGSQRLLWDMLNGQFPQPQDDREESAHPLQPNNLKLFIELSQLSNRQNYLTFHSASSINSITARDQVKDFMDNMMEFGEKYRLSFKKSTARYLPPASLQTFRMNDEALPGVVIADHDATFTNQYYNSIFDDVRALNYSYYQGSAPPEDSVQSFIANFSMVLAHSLYFEMTNTNSTNISVDPALVDELFHCYLETMNCTLFNAATYQGRLEEKPPTFYIGVNAIPSVMTLLTAHTLAFLTGQKVNKTKEECTADSQTPMYQYIYMNGRNEGNSTGVCIKTTMNYSMAESPAFMIEDYDWSSGQYSTWTESTWHEFRVRMFLKPSFRHEIVTLCIGLAVMFLSFVIVFFINSRSHVLFGDVLIATSC